MLLKRVSDYSIKLPYSEKFCKIDKGGRRLFCKTAQFRKCKICLHEKRCSTPPHSLQDRLSMPGEGGRKLFLVNGIIAISSLPLSRFWPVSTL